MPPRGEGLLAHRTGLGQEPVLALGHAVQWGAQVLPQEALVQEEVGVRCGRVRHHILCRQAQGGGG